MCVKSPLMRVNSVVSNLNSGGHCHCCLQEGEEAVTEWWKRSPEQWHSGELLLACGATAVADLRAAVAAELDYSCSAGIAHNKAGCRSAFLLSAEALMPSNCQVLFVA